MGLTKPQVIMKFKDFKMLKTNKFTANKSPHKTLTFIKQYLQIKRKKSFKFINSKKKKLLSPPKLKQIHFQELLSFYIVVNSGSINLASEQLRLSQPALTLLLQKVERQLGYLLFKESNSLKSLSLSIYGSILYNYIERIFELFNEVIELNTKLISKDLNVSEHLTRLNIYQIRYGLLSIKRNNNNNRVYLYNRKGCFLFPVKVDSLRVKVSYFETPSTDFVEINTLKALESSKSMKISPMFCWQMFR